MRTAVFSRWLPGASRNTMAALLLAAPVAAGAQGFAGTAAVAYGDASITVHNNVQTIKIRSNCPVTTINWTPTDKAIGGPPINFLPAGNTVNYVGANGASVPYTVLNRIIPNDQTRPVAFFGTVDSTPNVRLWFYSPGGLLIGATANFNIGGLILTAADPVTNRNKSFITTSAGTDTFALAAAAGSTSAITIQPGANITATNPGQSNYIVAIAPQINQGGTIGVAGSVALVAAESASFAVDSQGLFNITVTAGTTVATNGFVHTGSTGGPNLAPTGGFQRVYMVAVPKNNAISMAIASSGSIGFAVADAAKLDGDQIVLSAGSNIADAGSGNPVIAGRAGNGSASLTVGAGTYTSNTYAVSTDSVVVTDPAADIALKSNLTAIAPKATIHASTGVISVAGDLVVNADNSVDGVARTALVEVAQGASLAVGTNAAGLGVNGSLTETADDTLTGMGGSATLRATSGSIAINGNAVVSANGAWLALNQNTGGNITQGGIAQVAVGGGDLTVGGRLDVSAAADATGANAALISQTTNQGIFATGGSASVTATGASASIAANNGISAHADAVSGSDSFGQGGTATGGFALIAAQSGGTVGVGVNGAIATSASAASDYSFTDVSAGSGGISIGGLAQVIADGGSITVAGVNGISAIANATGGSPPAYSGNGGSATGGTALIETRGTNGSIATDTSGSTVVSTFFTDVEANAQGGNGSGFNSAGGNATGGSATIAVTGANQTIAINQGSGVLIGAQATGGVGAGTGGGNASGGTAQLLASGGAIAITNTSLTMNVGAAAGSGSTDNGGNATGGTIRLAASGSGTANVKIDTALSAFAVGGSSISGNGGNALGGNIFIDLGNNAVSFSGATVSDSLDASYIFGTSQFGSSGTATSAGGVRLTDLGSLSLAGTVILNANTPFYVQAGGSIDVPGSIVGTGAGAYLHVWADDLGSGAGTVTLANGAINLPGNQIDMYYNPTSLGTPTGFSSGIGAGNATAYQLVDNISQLQLAGNYLSQNFALGKNIDASATQGWNGGAGFVPIGNPGTPFTGNFDGLSHSISNLSINASGGGVGLFGQVGAGIGANIVIRNLGLTNAKVTGGSAVGSVIGAVGADYVTVSNSFATGGSVSGTDTVGGLIGTTSGSTAVVLTGLHSDASVFATGAGHAGGLVGSFTGTLSQSFATGPVTDNTAGASDLGGLIGQITGGTLSEAYATGAVIAGNGSSGIGGLVGYVGSGSINRAYAVGAINAGPGSGSLGGLVGLNNGAISESWASGQVTASSSANVGGFVGQNAGTGSIANAYWDSYSTGQKVGVGTDLSSVTQLNAVTSDPAKTGAVNYAFGKNAYGNLSTSGWLYDNNQTRPVGAWEEPVPQFAIAKISSAHQVQLIDFNLAGSYTVTQNIDMRGTAGTNDIWAPGGFMPIGGELASAPFTGTLEGAGHVLSNLAMIFSLDFTNSGFIQQNSGTISDIGLDNVNIIALQATNVGGLVGLNSGQITDSFATGTIALTQSSAQNGIAGGLVGLNSDGSMGGTIGSIAQSYATVAVSGGIAVGGLVGDNEGAISGTYANGPVSGTLTGGLVGQSLHSVGPVVTNSYWDTQLTGQSVGCGSVGIPGACGGATGLTTAQSLQAGSFTGFAIDTQGGQGLPWRQYQGMTTPLLAAFLTPVIVQAGSLTMQYNAQLAAVGVTAYGAQPFLTFGTAQIAGLAQNAGVASLSYAGGLYSNQLGYDFVPSSTPGVLVITSAPLTLAAVSDTRIYNATTGSTGVAQVSGLFSADNVTNLTQSYSSPNAMGVNGSTLAVNAGYVVNDGNGGNNYAITLQTVSGTITPAALAITYTANGATSIYGTAISGLTGAVGTMGLQGSDTLSAVTLGTASFATSATAQSNVGSYAVTGSGLTGSSANYSFSFAQASGNATALTIVARALTLTAAPLSRVYGSINPVTDTATAAPATATTGLVNGDSVSSEAVTSPATSGSGVGLYALNGSAARFSQGIGTNYAIVYAASPAALSITPAGLTLVYTGAPASSTYGTTLSGLTGSTSFTGLVNGDTAASVTSGSAMWTSPATSVSSVGNYAIDGSGIGLVSANYSLTAMQAAGNATALTVNPAVLTITYTASPVGRSYGAANPALSGIEVTSGLVNGDTLGNVTSGTAAFTTAATGQSATGNYAVAGSGLAGSSANYTFSFAQAPANATALTIVPRPITVTADAQQRPVGAADPSLTYVVTGSSATIMPGLVNGDQLTGQLVSTVTATAPAGSYGILQGTLAASANYQLTYVGNTLTVVNGTAALVPIANSIAANLPDQSGTSLTKRRKQEATKLAAVSVGLGLYPPQIARSLIDIQLVTTSPPVKDPVTSNGNASLWSRTAP